MSSGGTTDAGLERWRLILGEAADRSKPLGTGLLSDEAERILRKVSA